MTQALVHQISEGAAQNVWRADAGPQPSPGVGGRLWHLAGETGGHVRRFQATFRGEQMSAALAVRLALVREWAINVAFFDEPTANLDAQRRGALAQQIMSVRWFRKLFVISHDDIV